MTTQGSRNLPAQTIPNPNVSAITLRSGKNVDVEVSTSTETSVEKNVKIDKNKQTPIFAPTPKSPTLEPDEEDEQYIPLPFPQRAVMSKKTDQLDKERGILDVFKKVEVNIPLLEAIKQIPKYAKFLKEMCTNKRKLKGKSRVNMSRNVSAIIQQIGLPEMCEDPGVFTIPCTIEDIEFRNCMLDLGSSINVMPIFVYNSLSLGPLQPTGLVIQLANRSITRPKGVVEDVLVKVDGLIFPADFYILDMQRETSSSKATLIFGRPFLRTARTKIDVYAGTLSIEFGDNIINFNIFDAMKHPNEEHSLFALELLADLIDDEFTNEFTANYPSFSDLDDTYTCESCTDVQLCSTCVENNFQVNSHDATDGTNTNNTNSSVPDTVTNDTCTDNVTNHNCIVSSIEIHDAANVDITADS